jgi:hypothetical protein
VHIEAVIEATPTEGCIRSSMIWSSPTHQQPEAIQRYSDRELGWAWLAVVARNDSSDRHARKLRDDRGSRPASGEPPDLGSLPPPGRGLLNEREACSREYEAVDQRRFRSVASAASITNQELDSVALFGWPTNLILSAQESRQAR